jgi:pimeloyl-ACP methyl ester carboxylesterase
VDLKSRELDINGLAMHVVLAGTGTPLLLLHGFPDSAKLWREMIPGLVAAGFRVIAPDQRGYGDTTAPAETSAYSIEKIAADAIALLDALGIKRAGLVGHDWGSVIGWWLAARHPERFSCFVALSVGHPKAVAGAGWRQKLRSWYFLLFLLPGFGEAVVRAFNFAMLAWMTHGAPEIANWRRDLSRPGRLTAGMNWYRANLQSMAKGSFDNARVPVLGLVGSADVALGIAQMTRSQDYADASFDSAVIAGAGHWMPLYSAPALLEHAVPFLKGHCDG